MKRKSPEDMRQIDPVKNDARRQQILAAAMKCFIRKGFRGASISEICAQAEISPGHLYHYFSGKDAIVEAMAAGGLSAAINHFKTIMEGPDPLAALLAQLDLLKSPYFRDALVVLLEILAESTRNRSIARMLHENSLAMRNLLADTLRTLQTRGLLEPALDPEIAATIVIAVVDGARLIPVRNPEADMDGCIDNLKTLIVRFLAPSHHPAAAP